MGKKENKLKTRYNRKRIEIWISLVIFMLFLGGILISIITDLIFREGIFYSYNFGSVIGSILGIYFIIYIPLKTMYLDITKK